MLKVLVFSRTAWRTDNSFGNSYSNWFSDLDDVVVAHICLADGVPFKENNVKHYFQVSEKKLAKSVFKRNTYETSVGEIAYAVEPYIEKCKHNRSLFDKILSFCKIHRLPLFFLLREAIWKYGNVNYSDMSSFIKNFKPDVVFMPLYYAGYVDRIALNALKGLNIPIVLEAAIDVYSLKQLSFDPLFWLNRFFVRYKTRQICSAANMLYVISDKMRKDYSRYFKLPIKVTYKFPDLSRCLYEYCSVSKPVKYFYAGNLGAGRWKSLAMLVKSLQRNGNGYIDIYTPTPLTQKQRMLLNIDGVSVIHPPISQAEVIKLQNAADILVHVESFEIRDKLEVRYSISTKIMDYISIGRCILAIGPSDIASMMYLNDNHLAFIANNENELDSIIAELNFSKVAILNSAQQNNKYVNSIDSNSLKKQFRRDLVNVSKMGV